MASPQEAFEKYSSKPWLKSYDEGVPSEIEIPEKPLYWILEQAAEQFPNRTALHFLGRNVSYKELLDSAKRFASYLKSRGVGKGDVVGLFLPNSPMFAIAYYGTLMAGATVSPMNVLYSPSEIHHQLEDNGAKILVAIDVFKDKVEAGVPGTVREIVWTGIQDYLPGIKAFLYKLKYKPPKITEDDRNKLLKNILKEYQPIDEPVKVDPKNDIAALMYTGGTTGVPKGAELTHYNLLSNVLQIDSWYKRGVKGKDVFVGALPWFHIYGQTAVLNTGIYRAATILVFPRWDVKQVMRAIAKFRANMFHGVPLMYISIINHPEVKKFDLTSLEACISGAAPLPVAVAKKFEELTGAKLREGYGLTETSPVTHVNPILGKAKVGSIGVPVPSTIAAVADPEEPVLLPPGEVGELVISGPQVMKGYHNMPEENKKVFFECCGRRWVRTGDMAKMDEEGYFFIVDRKKDIIKYKGYSVFPREIEEVLYKHECIQEAAVIGVPHPEYFEYPKAFIVLKPECKGKVTEQDIIEYARKHLAPYKVPKAVEFRDDLPKSAVGKILRRLLREEEIKKQKQ
ncbi:MAG: long-chain fatty acid--CoA ligase [Desulfurococcales archaeon]|nr:long-chain fatty acid--CoA ligase [Desulfurococcales archaeon]MEB3788727.1 long-chain fatty acid--CoA ligase [Desulfurococcales archaeon]